MHEKLCCVRVFCSQCGQFDVFCAMFGPAKRGAGGGPSDMTVEHVQPWLLDHTKDSHCRKSSEEVVTNVGAYPEKCANAAN